jgi:hypothetical protein
MCDSSVTRSQPPSNDTEWQNEKVEKSEATQHSKPKNKIRISAQLRALAHILKN